MKIPEEIKNGCPDICPVCGKKAICVFRSWKTKTRNVLVEFMHNDGSECKKYYQYE